MIQKTNFQAFWLLPISGLAECTPRLVFSLSFLGSSLLVSFAYYLQYIQGLMPCALCLLERGLMIVLAATCLLAVLHDPKGKGKYHYGLLTGAISLLGAALAGYHVWLQLFRQQANEVCLPPLDYLLKAFPFPEVLQLVLQNPYDCSTIHWQWLGLSIPAWTLLAFVVIGSGIAAGLMNARQHLD